MLIYGSGMKSQVFKAIPGTASSQFTPPKYREVDPTSEEVPAWVREWYIDRIR